MKQNEAKKWEHQNIVKAKELYWAAQEELNKAEGNFIKLSCRFRSAGLCTHSRHTMKKYPGHIPIMPLCGVPVCPID